MLAITQYADQRIKAARHKYLPTEEKKIRNTRFVDNLFAKQLAENKALAHYINNTGISWSNQESFIKSFYEELVAEDFFQEYMNEPVASYESDKEIWRKIFKRLLTHNELLEEVLEEQSIYWNDDLEIISTFVIKTIKRFDQQQGANQPLLPMYKDESDRAFAVKLFNMSILHGDQYRLLIEEAIKNWDLDRLALMDLFILQVALAEIMEIEEVPVKVTLNEYIEMAKMYSTPKSGLFVNGILDQLVKTLKDQQKLFKS